MNIPKMFNFLFLNTFSGILPQPKEIRISAFLFFNVEIIFFKIFSCKIVLSEVNFELLILKSPKIFFQTELFY